MKNLHKHKNLMGFIYSIVMLLPFLTILVRSCYVTFNKNAYESYSDTTTTINYIETDKDNLVLNNTYSYIYSSNLTINGTIRINCDAIRIYQTGQQPVDVSNYHSIYINNEKINLIQSGLPTFVGTYASGYYRVDFLYVSTIEDTLTINGGFYRHEITTISNAIDNVFEYSIDKTISNSNIGKLNLTNWFVDIFLDDTNVTNMRYINFVNWYMNYSLLVSCVYLLYMVLMWFLTFARKLLSKGFNEEI